MAGCTSNDFLGDEKYAQLAESSNAINFGPNVGATSRADAIGADAATVLNNEFTVFGVKNAAAEDGTAGEAAFQNYKVAWTANSAGTTESNTNNWEYVGVTPYTATQVSPAPTGQTIKYWDYTNPSYTFYGIAGKALFDANKVSITKVLTGATVYDKGYTVQLAADADLTQLFVADRKVVEKANYGKPVTLTFRNFGAKVRVGFYETIPGYSVKITKFYAVPAAATAPVTAFGDLDDVNTTNFAAALQNVNKAATSNEITVSYYNGTNGPENLAKLTNTTVGYNYGLTLGTGVVNTTLGTSSDAPTWDQTGGAYTPVYPFEANTTPMLLMVDFTLTAEDGSNETIDVKSAKVVVPAQYVQWKSNYAYTYLFKISDNTNGTTGAVDPADPSTPQDPEGLFPITFDAVTVDVTNGNEQETITTFADYSVTTYANGSKVTTNNEYKTGEDIYVVKTNNASAGAVVAPTAIGTAANNAQVYKAETTGDAITEATVFANLTGAPNGITLTAETASLEQNAPAADGPAYDFGANGAVKFTPTAAGTYAYVFTRTVYVAPTYTAVDAAATFSETTTYYMKTTGDVYYAVSVPSAAAFDANKANLYTKTADGTAGEYDIKVIKVQ